VTTPADTSPSEAAPTETAPTDGALERQEPPISAVSQPFWDATRSKRLVIQHCTACDRAVWFPRVACPHCLSQELEWRESQGSGTIYAVSVQYRPGNAQMRDRVPYAVVLIDMAEGVRIMSNVVGCDVDDVIIDKPVTAAWEPLSDGRHLLVFELAAE
jgi:uncharacterized OB-fold protein